MFEIFKSSFAVFRSVENPIIEMKSIPFKYSELLLEFGGKSFDKGLYTIHTFSNSLKWAEILSNYFEGYKHEILPFAYDWLGRQYCVPIKGFESVYMFDPADIKDYRLDENLIDFHNFTLAEGKEETLDVDIFEEILNILHLNGLSQNQCIGFKTPLFLNGKPELSNYEVGDLDVYWDFEYQLYQQVKNLPEGTRVHNIVINPFTNKL